MVSHSGRRVAAATRISLTAKNQKPAKAAPKRRDHDRDYATLLNELQAGFRAAGRHASHVFMTDAPGLYETYLKWLPGEKQIHTCNTCRRFIETYGALAFIDGDGKLRSAMWNERGMPDFYAASIAGMARKVEQARITGVFLSKDRVWGAPSTGAWTHFSAAPSVTLLHADRALDAHQTMAAVKQRFQTVTTALGEFSAKLLDEGLRVLEADAVNRSEKFIGPMKWLRDLHDRPKGRRGENVLWARVAAAPEGYCHPRTSVIGSLLEDLATGMHFEDVRRRFNAKMHPLQYQRPQAAPAAGAVKAAEDLFAKLGLASALERRFACLEDCETDWEPMPLRKIKNATTLFGHLKTKEDPTVRHATLPTQTMTWAKFAKTVLPGAEAMEFYVPSKGNFVALTTAVDRKAKPLFKWDNPVAWYVYMGGSTAAHWGLAGGEYVRVNAVVPLPNLWGKKPMPELAEGVILVLDGARDRHNSALGIFPECIRGDLHGVRSVIEAHSASSKLQGAAQASACGYDFRKESAAGTLRVLKGGAWNRYNIDRWD